MARTSRVVLVTGCCGFIGSHTVERLLHMGERVIGVDNMNDYYSVEIKEGNLRLLQDLGRRKAREAAPQQQQEEEDQPGGAWSSSHFVFHREDVADREAMGRLFLGPHGGQIETVVHLAARAGVRASLQNPEECLRSNVEGTAVLMDLAGKAGGVKRFVYASSSSVYGANTKVPFSEEDAVEHPVSPYAASKRACELLAWTYHALYGYQVTGLRFFTVYGPRGRPDMAPFKFAERILRGQEIDQYGDGSSRRDYTYISDIVQGILGAVGRTKGAGCEVVNLGNSRVVSLSEFIGVVEEAVGSRAKIRRLPDQPGDVPLTYADCTKARRLLGYSPSYDIRSGMREFVAWYRQFYSLPHLSSSPSLSPSPVPVAIKGAAKAAPARLLKAKAAAAAAAAAAMSLEHSSLSSSSLSDDSPLSTEVESSDSD